MTDFLSKYRGTVENNIDPMQLGRIQVNVPSVLGEGRMSWAMPCVPYAGSGVGFFAIPPVGANVWIEFEGGNPDYPIWSGCFWGVGEVPAMPAIAGMKVLKTDMGTITINDLPGVGGITIETTTGMKIEINALGIEITNGQGASIKLTGPQVSINDGALDVI
ncbi:MAG TPA: phage baseplate assembly protein V [Candidatus Nanoarchaeia archaeon]|nr:phage baseplate assembly protein V [Candidatus Nanoarchaeia archaeon]